MYPTSKYTNGEHTIYVLNTSKLLNNEMKLACPIWSEGSQTDCCCKLTLSKALISMCYCTSLAISEILNENQALTSRFFWKSKCTSSPHRHHFTLEGRPIPFGTSVVASRRFKLCKKITAKGLVTSLTIYLHAYDGAAVHLQHEELPSW